MAFQVEDGTGLDNATAYLSVADYRAYHADRGLVIPSTGEGAQTDGEVQGYLVLATDYLDGLYGARARGIRLETDQSLVWPRLSAYDSEGVLIEGVPTKLEAATAEAAYLASQRTLIPNPPAAVSSTGAPTAQTPIVRTLERVENAVTEETEYAQPSSAATVGQSVPVYPKIDRLMRPLVHSVQAVRA